MPVQEKTLIASIAFIAIVTASVALMQSVPLKASMLNSGSRTAGPTELTDQTVLKALNGTSMLVLDFYYPDCGKCELVNATVSELWNELDGQVSFGRMNIEANPQTAKKFKISSYPTLLFFDGGVLMDRMKGDISKLDLLDHIKELKPDLNTSRVTIQVGAGPSSNPIPLASFEEIRPSRPILLTDDNLDLAIKKYPYLVVDSFAQWCEYCHFLNTTISQLSSELQGQVVFGLADAEQNNFSIKNRYNLSAYPTLLIYKDGQLVSQLTGNKPKAVIVAQLEKDYPNLNTSSVNLTQIQTQTPAVIPAPVTPKQTPQQVCANMTKSDHPLLEAFVVSRCPFGLQMQRILAEVVSKIPSSNDYMKVRYIGSITNGTITSMHGDGEAKENLRQICIRDEQAYKYWDYVRCYMKEGNSSGCLKLESVDQKRLGSCINDSSRGLAYAQKDFDLSNQSHITGSPTLTLNGKVVSEFDFATNTTDGRSPEALKELLCCGFNRQPSFCAQKLNTTQAITMFSVQVKAAKTASQGRDIPLIKPGSKNPTQAMLITDETMNSTLSQYPLLVVEGFANWCGFCKLFNVTISDLSSELGGQVAFGLIDVYKNNNQTATRYNISAYPTLLIFKDGKLVDKVIGNKDKSSFVDKLRPLDPSVTTPMTEVMGI